MNQTIFYDSLRAGDMFGGSLNTNQVNGIQALLDQWGQVSSVDSARQLGYVLGTVYREAGKGMYPVREGFCTSDAASITEVTAMFNRGEISTNYAAIDPVTGKAYFGRGQIQLTWPTNYRNIGKLIGVDIYSDPDRVLEPEISAKIAIGGMEGGWFTGKKLRDYINITTFDYVNARRIINGTDHATLVAGYATRFLDAINSAM